MKGRRAEQLAKWDAMVLDPTSKAWYDTTPFYKADGHWQYSVESMVLMFMHVSSIQYDSKRSGQNKYIGESVLILPHIRSPIYLLTPQSFLSQRTTSATAAPPTASTSSASTSSARTARTCTRQ